MFGEFIRCEKHGEEGMRHDEKHGYWCELCELGYPRQQTCSHEETYINPLSGYVDCMACGEPLHEASR